MVRRVKPKKCDSFISVCFPLSANKINRLKNQRNYPETFGRTLVVCPQPRPRKTTEKLPFCQKLPEHCGKTPAAIKCFRDFKEGRMAIPALVLALDR